MFETISKSPVELNDNGFNELFETKFHKYKDQLESIFVHVPLGVVNLNQMIFRCSLIHYGMKMLMIIIFLMLENVLPLKIYLG